MDNIMEWTIAAILLIVARVVWKQWSHTFVVDEGYTGLLYQKGQYLRTLEPGEHRLFGEDYHVTPVDIRKTLVTVPGQEVLTADNITIKVPETSATTVGLRSPHTAQEIDTLLATLQTTPDLPDENWAHHFKANQHRLASGQLAEVITIIHELHYRRLTKPLSSGEKRLYQQALTIVTSEISVSKNITINEAETLILAALPLLPTVEELTAK